VSRVITWFVNNPVAANLLMCVLVVGGLITLPQIRQEEFPSIDLEIVRVSVVYLGAAPEEVEQGVCVRIEEELEGTNGIERVTSLSVEGACVTTVELVQGTDGNTVGNEIKNRIDGITTFPIETEKPVISRLVMRGEAVRLALVADADEQTLRVLGSRTRDEIAALPGVSQVDLSYTKPYEISLEVPEEVLRRHGLSLAEVANAVRRASLDMPGGSVKTAGGEILLRTKGQAYWGREFEEIVVLTRPDGTSLSLGEIATVRDGFEDVDLEARFNGRPAVLISVFRVGEEDTIAIAKAVTAYLEEARERLPEGAELVIYRDEAESLQIRLRVLQRSALGGLALVLLILGLFLQFRLAMWVAAGVPIAFLGALALFPTLGLSISSLSVMAFILVLGIVVDDAIVIGESVYTHERRDGDQLRAAITGTQEVYVPVIFGVMTTVAAFLPLVMVPGRMGQFFSVIGVTAIVCLALSLVESQLVLPAHLAHRRTSREGGRSNRFVATWKRLQSYLTDGLEHFARDVYGRWLVVAIEWRYVTVAAAIGVLVLSVGLFASGRLRYQFLPAVEGDVVYASLTMPPGSPVEVTQSAVDQIEAAADALDEQLVDASGASIVVHRLTTIGNHQGRDGPPSSRFSSGGSHLAEVSLELVSGSRRDVSGNQVADRWRELVGAVPGVVELTYSASVFSAGHALAVELRGGTIPELTAAAADLKRLLAGYEGVSDIADSFRSGKLEVKLAILPEAKPLGLTLDDLGRQVRQAFYGYEAQRIQRGRDDVRVMLRYPKSERRSLGYLEEMRIRTTDGAEVPFASVAKAEIGRGYSTIRRSDRERVVEVTADVDRAVITPEALIARVQRQLPALLANHPGVNSSLAGEQREHGKALQGLLRGGILAALLIYALLAIPLHSYVQPLIIMAVIPFGTAGAIVGHLIMGWDVVFFSVLGMVALAGVVVNASLVMVHFVNLRRAQGVPFLEAVSTAGVARFRPIALTAATTFVGLVPLMFEANPQATMMIPMAISLGYGVVFAGAFTLVLVPCLYVILDDVGALWRRIQGAPEPAREPSVF
jgi:multidrug efflux pump subunit AcrB